MNISYTRALTHIRRTKSHNMWSTNITVAVQYNLTKNVYILNFNVFEVHKIWAHALWIYTGLVCALSKSTMIIHPQNLCSFPPDNLYFRIITSGFKQEIFPATFTCSQRFSSTSPCTNVRFTKLPDDDATTQPPATNFTGAKPENSLSLLGDTAH